MTFEDLWRRAQHGWPARYPVVQFPNPPLLVAFAGWLTGRLTDGSVHSHARAVFLAGLAAWAWSELTEGANGVRRALGAGGFAYVVATVATALTGRS